MKTMAVVRKLATLLMVVGLTIGAHTTTLSTDTVATGIWTPPFPKASRTPKPKHLTSRGDSGLLDDAQSPWQPFIATWYSGSGGSDGGSVTKTGTTVRDNWTIAVDPDVIPLGSTVEIKFRNGQVRLYHAEDTGGDIQGNRIDIYDSDLYRCYKNGRQLVQVRIIPKEGS